MSLEGLADEQQLSAARLIPAALAAGALSAADVVHHGVSVEQRGRSHPVYCVSVGGQARFFVKTFGPRRGATDGLAEREWALQALAQERPAVAALVPPAWPWLHDAAGVPTTKVVANAAVAGAEAWTLDHNSGPDGSQRAWNDLVQALVPPLAAFHRATRDLARPGASVPTCLEPATPWGLSLMDGDAAPELWAGPATAVLLREAAADATFVAALRAVRSLWRPLALIHADLKHDNVLVERSGYGLKVHVLDWEMARIGDPAWDLASLSARLAALRQDGPPWPDRDMAAAATLVGHYAAASGLAVPGLAQRVMSYASVVLLMMCLQHGSTLAPGGDLGSARSLLMKARSTLHRIDNLSQALAAQAQGARA